jgi:hypothetical protein
MHITYHIDVIRKSWGMLESGSKCSSWHANSHEPGWTRTWVVGSGRSFPFGLRCGAVNCKLSICTCVSWCTTAQGMMWGFRSCVRLIPKSRRYRQLIHVSVESNRIISGLGGCCIYSVVGPFVLLLRLHNVRGEFWFPACIVTHRVHTFSVCAPAYIG